MTITLHWWLVPVTLIVAGLIGMHLDKRTGSYMGGMAGALWFLGCCACAIAFTAGHFL